MNPFERAARRVDGAQRQWTPAAFTFAVVRKFGDDQGGNLTGILTYYGFVSVFPLLLVLMTVVGLVAGVDASFANRILHSALSQFPLIGTKLGSNIHRLRSDSAVGLVIGVLGLLWGSLGVSQAGQYAMAQVWGIPQVSRPGFLPRLGRSALVLLVGAGFLVAAAGIATVVAVGHSAVWSAAGGVVGLATDVVLFVLVFRLLTPHAVRTADLVLGAVMAGVAWTVLQDLGVYLVAHEMRHMSEVYGFFAVVLGAMWWIALAARMTLYAAEVNVVRARRLWPRSLVQPPLTDADRAQLESLIRMETRRPEVRAVAAGGDALGDPGEPVAATNDPQRPFQASADRVAVERLSQRR